MNKKWVPYLIILLLAIAVFAIKRWQDNKEPSPKKKDRTTTTVNRNRGFDRRTSYLEFSKHAQCRMDCRKISRSEVEEIMKEGKINYAKSDVRNARCPRYALEGTTSDDQRVRIVYAQCDEKTVVVTVIDLGTEWTCDCPGDDGPSSSKITR